MRVGKTSGFSQAVEVNDKTDILVFALGVGKVDVIGLYVEEIIYGEFSCWSTICKIQVLVWASKTPVTALPDEGQNHTCSNMYFLTTSIVKGKREVITHCDALHSDRAFTLALQIQCHGVACFSCPSVTKWFASLCIQMKSHLYDVSRIY